jgi:hypothetical protein
VFFQRILRTVPCSLELLSEVSKPRLDDCLLGIVVARAPRQALDQAPETGRIRLHEMLTCIVNFLGTSRG